MMIIRMIIIKIIVIVKVIVIIIIIIKIIIIINMRSSPHTYVRMFSSKKSVEKRSH